MTLSGFKLLSGLFFVIGGFLFCIFASSIIRKHKIKKAVNSDFPQDWLTILEEDFPPYKKISRQLQTRLQDRIKIFIFTKEFIGYKNSEVDNDIQVLIAAQASMLLLNDEKDFFPQVKRIYIYPREMICKKTGNAIAGYLENKGGRTAIIAEISAPEVRAIVFAWNIAKKDIQSNNDKNIVVRLFAAALDMQNAIFAATPDLTGQKVHKNWDDVIKKHFPSKDIHAGNIKINGTPILSKMDIFSTITEQFFQTPKQLKSYSEEVYLLLVDYYGIDPLGL